MCAVCEGLENTMCMKNGVITHTTLHKCAPLRSSVVCGLCAVEGVIWMRRIAVHR